MILKKSPMGRREKIEKKINKNKAGGRGEVQK